MIGRFHVITDAGPDGNATDRWAIFDHVSDWPACKTIGSGEDDPRYTMLTREQAEQVAAELNAKRFAPEPDEPVPGILTLPTMASSEEVELPTGSEFGAGIVVCLAKFSEHLWNRDSPNPHEKADPRSVAIYGSPEAYLSNQIEMWMNGASDHMIDLDDRAPETLKELASLALSIGHGFTGEQWTMEHVRKIRELWRESCLAVDRMLGVEPDWGS